jgi:hypothetical protein
MFPPFRDQQERWWEEWLWIHSTAAARESSRERAEARVKSFAFMV